MRISMKAVNAVIVLTCTLLLVASNAWAVKTPVNKAPTRLTLEEARFVLEVPDNVHPAVVKMELLPLDTSKIPAAEGIQIVRAVDVGMTAYLDEPVSTIAKPVRLIFNFDYIDYNRAANMDGSQPLGRFRVGIWNTSRGAWQFIPSTIFWNGNEGVVEGESQYGAGKYALLWSDEWNADFTPMAAEQIRIMVNYNVVHPLVPPYIKAGRTMVPLKVIAESMGVRVYWNGDEQRIDLVDANKTIKLWIGSSLVQIDGQNLTTQVPPEIAQSTTFVPLAFVGDALGAQIAWDPLTRTAKLIKQ